MAAKPKSKTPGTPEYKRRQKRIDARGGKPAPKKPGQSKVPGTPEYERRQMRQAVEAAMGLVAPQLNQAQNEAATLEQHAQAGGGIDQAHNRYAGHVQRAVQSSNFMAPPPPAAPTGPVATTTGPAPGQVAGAEAQKFGLTSKAAEVTAQTEAQANAYLQQTQATQAGVAQVQAGNYQQVLAGLMAAGEFRREDARTRTQGAAAQARTNVAGIKTQARAQAGQNIAQSQQQEFANRLAERSLGLEEGELRLDRAKERNDVRNERRDDRRDRWKTKLNDRQKRHLASVQAQL